MARTKQRPRSAFVQPAVARTEVALDATIGEKAPPAGIHHARADSTFLVKFAFGWGS